MNRERRILALAALTAGLLSATPAVAQDVQTVDIANKMTEVVDNLASGVRAGLSLPEALTQVGLRGPDELRRPFIRFGEDYRATGRFYECLDRLKAGLADPVGDRIVESLRMAREVAAFSPVPRVGDALYLGLTDPVPRCVVRVDFEALFRGHPVEGEVCEIAGYGPVPVSVVNDLLAQGVADELTATIVEVNPAETWVTHGAEEGLMRWAELNQRRARALALVGYEDEDE